jgi:recombination protein RecA
VKVVKNKVAAPFKATEFDLIYNEGISREGELLALGEKYGFVKKSGASYTYLPPGGDASAEVKLGRGYDAARTTVREEKKLQNELMKHIRAALKDDAAPVAKAKPIADTDEAESKAEAE